MVPYGSTQSERRVMARALALFFAAGGGLVLLTLALPRAGDAQVPELAVPSLIAFGVAGALAALGPRASVRFLQVTLVGGAALITACVLLAGRGGAVYPTLYLLVASYAFFFFRLRAALVQIALVGAAYAGALAVTDGTRLPEATWLMVLGCIAVSGALVGQLVAAVRAHAADVAAVSQMAGSSDATLALRTTCEAVARSLGADVAAILQPGRDTGALEVLALAGAAEGALVLTRSGPREAIERAFGTGRPEVLHTTRPARLAGTTLGLAQPVLREAGAVAVLVVAWTAPRRRLPGRARAAVPLFATEAGLVLDRAEREAQARERQALEINDGIVQGLVVAKYSAQRGDAGASLQAIDEALRSARELISDQLAGVVSGRGIQPGDLARAEAAGVGTPPAVSPAGRAAPPPPASPR